MTTECPECGSERLIGIGQIGPTGVTSPDGDQEYCYQHALQCLDCGATQPDEEQP
jgi:hypothetical protein